MEKTKIIGIVNVSFTAKDGTEITGKTLYFTEPIPADRGIGYSADKAFISTKKLGEISLNVGDYVELLYNKFGKIASIRPVTADDTLDFGD